MKRIVPVAICIATAILLLFSTGTAFAAGSNAIVVSPIIPKAGDTITVTGVQLGGNSSVEIRVIGSGVDLDLGETKADNAGGFTAAFRLPVDLKPGSYQVRATGADSATTQITVVGGSAESPATPVAGMPVRSRPFGQAILLVTIFGVLAGLGLFFARGTQEAIASPKRSDASGFHESAEAEQQQAQ